MPFGICFFYGGDEENRASKIAASARRPQEKLAVPAVAPLTHKTVHRTVLLYRSCFRSSILFYSQTKKATTVAFLFVVEMRRIELLSGNLSFGMSTGLVYGLNFFPSGHRKRSPLGHSFLYLIC